MARPGIKVREPQAAEISIPASPLRTAKLMDGIVWDGKDPKAYAAGFKIKM